MNNANRHWKLRGVTACAVALLRALDTGRITEEELDIIRKTIEGTCKDIGLRYSPPPSTPNDTAERLYTELSTKESML